MSILLWAKKRGPMEPKPVMAGLQALYLFDEGTGQTANDSSGAGRHATLGSTAGVDTNDPMWTAAGLSFATDDFVNCGDAAALRPAAWTVCVAAKLTPNTVVPIFGWHPTAQTPAVYAAAPFNQNRPLIWLANNCFRYFEKANPVNVADGGWHFLVFACPGNLAADIAGSSLTVDGQAQAVQSTTNTENGGTKSVCRIGAAGTAQFATAEMAFVSLHDRVLNVDERAAMRTYATAKLAGRVALP